MFIKTTWFSIFLIFNVIAIPWKVAAEPSENSNLLLLHDFVLEPDLGTHILTNCYILYNRNSKKIQEHTQQKQYAVIVYELNSKNTGLSDKSSADTTIFNTLKLAVGKLAEYRGSTEVNDKPISLLDLRDLQPDRYGLYTSDIFNDYDSSQIAWSVFFNTTAIEKSDIIKKYLSDSVFTDIFSIASISINFGNTVNFLSADSGYQINYYFDKHRYLSSKILIKSTYYLTDNIAGLDNYLVTYYMVNSELVFLLNNNYSHKNISQLSVGCALFSSLYNTHPTSLSWDAAHFIDDFDYQNVYLNIVNNIEYQISTIDCSLLFYIKILF